MSKGSDHRKFCFQKSSHQNLDTMLLAWNTFRTRRFAWALIVFLQSGVMSGFAGHSHSHRVGVVFGVGIVCQFSPFSLNFRWIMSFRTWLNFVTFVVQFPCTKCLEAVNKLLHWFSQKCFLRRLREWSFLQLVLFDRQLFGAVLLDDHHSHISRPQSGVWSEAFVPLHHNQLLDMSRRHRTFVLVINELQTKTSFCGALAAVNIWWPWMLCCVVVVQRRVAVGCKGRQCRDFFLCGYLKLGETQKQKSLVTCVNRTRVIMFGSVCTTRRRGIQLQECEKEQLFVWKNKTVLVKSARVAKQKWFQVLVCWLVFAHTFSWVFKWETAEPSFQRKTCSNSRNTSGSAQGQGHENRSLLVHTSS